MLTGINDFSIDLNTTPLSRGVKLVEPVIL